MNILKRIRLHKEKEAETIAGLERIDATPEEIAKAIFDMVDVPVVEDGTRVAQEGQ